MKRTIRKHMTLAEVIAIVSKLSRSDHETALVVADMLNRGLIRFAGTLRHHKVVVK